MSGGSKDADLRPPDDIEPFLSHLAVSISACDWERSFGQSTQLCKRFLGVSVTECGGESRAKCTKQRTDRVAGPVRGCNFK